MIHDAILLLWDYPVKIDQSRPDNDFKEYTDHLSAPEKEIFLKIMKIAKIHGLIRNFIKKYSFVAKEHVLIRHSKIVYSKSGLYAQALSEGLDEVLAPYQAHVLELEKRALENPHLSLSFVLGSLEKFKFILNTLSRILFSIKENKLYGGQILTVLSYHSTSGNKETAEAIQRLLCIVHKVFYDQLCSWLLYGQLRDNYEEFLVHAVDKQQSTLSPPSYNTSKGHSINSNDDVHTTKTSNNSNVKENKNIDFEINLSMLPYYIPLSLAQKILFIGKSVLLFDSNPIEANRTSSRFMLSEKDFNKRFTIWGSKEPTFHKTIQALKNAESFDVHQLNLLVDEVKACVTEHLWVIAGEEAGVLHELQLMKDFFLLGRGELFLELLRLATPILNSQPTSVGTRDINHAFKMATRSVFLGNSKDIEKFSFYIPYNKHTNSSESFIANSEYGILDGWTTVTLKYNVKWPLHLLFTPDVLHQYNEMFRFLLRLKKTQHDLHLMWYSFKKTRQYGGSLWQLHNKLMFLMDHLQHYLQADVLESNYSKLRSEAENIKDFEQLKKAHQAFLIDILSQAFLLMAPNPEPGERDSYQNYNSNPVLSNIIEVLHLCDSVCMIAREAKSPEEERCLVSGFTSKFETLVGKLLQLLIALRTQPCGTHLARLLMRLDFNRWFSNTAHLTQSVSCML